MLFKNLLYVLTIIVFTSLVAAQTIHVDDFDYFVGCFAVKDTLDRTSLDLSQFIDWTITGSEVTYSKNQHWVRKQITDHNGKVKMGIQHFGYEKLRFYILKDYFGHESQVNVLTAWEKIGRDSLRYYCGQVKGFNTGIGNARIKHINIFPDSSLLLIISRGGEGYGGYVFYRGLTPNSFEEFYSRSWKYPFFETNGEYNEAYYDFRHVTDPYYQVVEVIEHIRVVVPEFSDTDYPPMKTLRPIESVTAKIINLWELANE